MAQYIHSRPREGQDNPMIRGFIEDENFTASQKSGTEILVDLKWLLQDVQKDTGNPYTIRAIIKRVNQTIIHVPMENASLRNAAIPTSQSTGSSTPGVSHTELGMDCDITVKIRDEALRKEIRKMQPADIVKRAERARAQAAKGIPSLALAGYVFIAARQLPSGDISLRASNAAAAENRVRVFGESAYVRMPTWGIVIDGMPIREADLSNDDFKQQLAAENQHAWGRKAEIEIAHVGWLTKPRSHEGSLVVEFTNPIVANDAISMGTIWRSRSHTNRPYCREGRCKMCKKCQKYGHVHAQCPNPKFICGFCAKEHPTWECPSHQNKEKDFTPKCANCKGPHKTVSTSCGLRREALEKAKYALINCEPFHRVPHYLQPKSMQQYTATNTDPTPYEAAQIQAVTKKHTTTKSTTAKSTSGATIAPITTRLQTPEAPTTSRIMPTAEKVRAIPFTTIEKRPGGRSSKSKSSKNDDSELEPTEQIQSALNITQSRQYDTVNGPNDKIQNPDPLTTYSLALKGSFHILLQPTPREEYEKRPRVCFSVNRGLDPATWEVQYHNRELSTLTLYTAAHGTIHIHNVYNPGVNSNEESVISALQTAMAPRAQYIVLGDFNRHHPLWAGTRYQHVDEEATELIDLMDEHRLEQLLPPGTITYERANAKSTIDLVWASHNLANRVVNCDTKREWWYGADHVPILTQFDLTAVRVPPMVRKQWNATDWDLFLKLMDTYYWHPRELNDNEAINEAIRYLVEAINQTAEQATPTKQITTYSRAGYTPEMAKLKHQVSRCRRHARRINTNQAWEDYAEARKEMKRRTNELARDLHRQRIEQATESIDGFWRIARWVRNRGKPRATFTPTLHYNNTNYTAPKEKAALFRKVLHPEPPEADLSDIGPQFRYPEPYMILPITLDEVRTAINNVKLDKAPGPDGIPNLVLQRLLPTIEAYLVNLFNACLRQ
ncbi:reverse transcriptase, putative [Talaromyces stipitatus ATCC 10500]|uniref:Reverse transcriptase, putative n=1 Tax=Talaromyces stipitatus (strain ATCC 10500 / CBS 375.48 / QM 6759 / NRRL 1006) TaxID=441959 RepID=B8MVC1_TALSN|nr:reverse transcriptase, putative [Talaromyces stipitatus ATCC 10500]EED11577.1 reverse transcriptase, putative [Talaromyces stipitatus ATCC 10500]